MKDDTTFVGKSSRQKPEGEEGHLVSILNLALPRRKLSEDAKSEKEGENKPRVFCIPLCCKIFVARSDESSEFRHSFNRGRILVGRLLANVVPSLVLVIVELEKQSFCELKVVNNTENYVAFKIGIGLMIVITGLDAALIDKAGGKPLLLGPLSTSKLKPIEVDYVAVRASNSFVVVPLLSLLSPPSISSDEDYDDDGDEDDTEDYS
ncbi:Vesicle-associated protein [Arachis hypogaea]|nr:Vesicle-associated protein [Arachis hypogaea]